MPTIRKHDKLKTQGQACLPSLGRPHTLLPRPLLSVCPWGNSKPLLHRPFVSSCQLFACSAGLGIDPIPPLRRLPLAQSPCYVSITGIGATHKNKGAHLSSKTNRQMSYFAGLFTLFIQSNINPQGKGCNQNWRPTLPNG